MKIFFIPLARAGLIDIGDYIAAGGRAVADHHVTGLEQACLRIADNPLMHALLEGHEKTGVRRRVHGKYLVFYRTTNGSVEIPRILHGARDYEAILFGEE
jgi:toxin ParE1/3/4